ncbi:MAG TPA: glycosyltransferase family protein [Vicinamibacterales bacterium]|nr:glycosyltransferase family protein [Vicinamibacterales bacterium]
MTRSSAHAVLAILQARVSSSRLPRKVLKPILGRPMLLHQIDRVRRARTLDGLVVATSTDPGDNAIEALCAAAGVRCYRGSLNDVLDRFYQAALPWQPQHVVRLTGDCPLADPDLIDRVVRACVDEALDYSGAEPSFPDGLDVEAMRFSALATAWKEAARPSDREHVTQFINRQRDRFRVRGVASDVDLSHLRWTVDEPADFELVTRIYEALYPSNPAFTTSDILDLLARQPELATLNKGIARNEGLARSLAADPPEDN